MVRIYVTIRFSQTHLICYNEIQFQVNLFYIFIIFHINYIYYLLATGVIGISSRNSIVTGAILYGNAVESVIGCLSTVNLTKQSF